MDGPPPVTVRAGDIWVADTGDEVRRSVLVASDARFHQLAGRAVVVPVLADVPERRMPWHVAVGERVVGVHLLAAVPIIRLLERIDTVSFDELRRVRTALREITN